MNESLLDLRDPLANASPEDAASIVEQALAPFSEAEPEEAPPIAEELAPVVLSNVASETGLSEEELVGAIRARPDLFPSGSAVTAEDFRLALQTAAEFASADRQLDDASERQTDADFYEAVATINSAEDADELREALDELENAVGTDDPRFQQTMLDLQEAGGGYASVAQEWLQERAEQDVADAQWRERNAHEAAAEAQVALQADIVSTMGKFVSKNRAEIEKVGPLFAELLPSTGIEQAESPEDAEARMAYALKGAQEAKRVTGVNQFVDTALDAQLAREYGYHGEEVPDHGPSAEVDLAKLELERPKHVQKSEFDAAWEKASRKAGGLF
jgi:DNA-binding phage protein